MSYTPSIWRRILDQLLVATASLKVANGGRIRQLELLNTTQMEAAVMPALHIVPDAEVVVEEDTRGYVLERTLFLRITYGYTKTPYPDAADLVSDVQTAIESDPQLDQLANNVRYLGETPYITDDGVREGTVLNYSIQYRRMRKDPTQME